ncbi:carbon-nitrogen hydrolase family protein [Vibrio metschnikovii]|uniref:carbon-nitrogen hydrolase family protein n=1 Tax=Vibrio metschnikovii TaxID=28172 RepID=UPI001302462D|nr:carbon-nitrogen hydrolase family protein [Vibrio metschnikovii]
MRRIGLVQMTSSDVVNDNLSYIEQQVAQLASQGAQLIVTPENATLFASHMQYQQNAEPLNVGPIQQRFALLAKQHQVYLLLGSLPIRRTTGITSTSILFGPQGEWLADYDKLHLFDVDVADQHRCYRESSLFCAGQRVVVANTGLANLGLSICYDLRFATLYSELRRKGAQILLVPAAFTAVTGQAHWELLLRARAIETQCWVVAVGQTGQHAGGRQTWGHSMVINPWGEITAALGPEADNLLVDIDLRSLQTIRQNMPVLEHTRFHHQFIEKKNPL